MSLCKYNTHTHTHLCRRQKMCIFSGLSKGMLPEVQNETCNSRWCLLGYILLVGFIYVTKSICVFDEHQIFPSSCKPCHPGLDAGMSDAFSVHRVHWILFIFIEHRQISSISLDYMYFIGMLYECSSMFKEFHVFCIQFMRSDRCSVATCGNRMMLPLQLVTIYPLVHEAWILLSWTLGGL